MPTLNTDDGVKLYYEETGSGTPILFVHEFAGDCRSWEPQVRHFSRRYRCITYNARGYPPSDVLPDPDRYSQERERDDVRCVLDALGLERAHVVGLSMGAMATLHFGMVHSGRALSLVTAGVGSGAHKSEYARFQADSRAHAKSILEHGMARFAAGYGENPTRVTMKAKDPRGFAEFQRHLSEHSAEGSANTMLGYQARRPSLYDLSAEMAAISGAAAGDRRRRGSVDDRAVAADQAHGAGRAARDAAEDRAHAQPRGTGAVQPPGRGLLSSSGDRACTRLMRFPTCA